MLEPDFIAPIRNRFGRRGIAKKMDLLDVSSRGVKNIAYAGKMTNHNSLACEKRWQAILYQIGIFSKSGIFRVIRYSFGGAVNLPESVKVFWVLWLTGGRVKIIFTSKFSKPNILILGGPRSGSTWLAKIFDSSADVLYRHEPDAVYRTANIPHHPESGDIDGLALPAAQYLSDISRIRHIKASGSLPSFPKSYRAPICEGIRNILIMACKVLGKATRPLGRELGFQIPDLIRVGDHSGVIVVVKSVDSLARAKLFSMADPSLKIVHIIRHPCAIVASQLRGKKLRIMSGETFLKTQAKMPKAKERGFSLSFLQNLSTEEQFASSWMLQNEKVMEDMSDNPNYRLVVYENLCANPLSVVEDLFTYAGIPMDRQSRDFINLSQSGDGENEKYFQIVRNSAKASQKWKEELSPDQISRVWNLVRDSRPGSLFEAPEIG